jgi:hypothetical protein
MNLLQHPKIFSAKTGNADSINDALFNGFQQYMDDDAIKRTHFFDGRYENIYIDESKIPEKRLILEQVINFASQILNKPKSELKAGLWFNGMGPGHSTTAHTHDDDDELLSAVYYVRTPPLSGQLVMRHKQFTTTVAPEAGMFAFFPPDIIHEVTENKSQHMRLSLGINIGPNK